MTGFPANFLWGTATSAHQIEGSPLADGAGPSIWHRFEHSPGTIRNGDTADVACDHYRRFREDIALMRALGLTAYRFSIAWARVLPDGRGPVNGAGLGFYDRLVDSLLENGIEPVATLYHWDLPAALDESGGWLNADVASWFADYATAMFRALDGRVKKWITLNEPWVVTDGGYLTGVLAPGHRSCFEAPIATHNLLRSHGSAVLAYRADGRHEIGIAINVEPKYSASDSAEDLAATARADAYMNRQYLDPLLLGRYPDEMPQIFREAWTAAAPEDLVLIRQPIDFLGLNYYTRAVVRADPDDGFLGAARVRQPARYTETDWEVYPQGLSDTLVWMRKRYGAVPIYITENGAAFADAATVTAPELDDPLRIDYLKQHLLALRSAMQAGVDVRGYFVWSLLDNFEWAEGYSKRFGLFHVDLASQRRTPKASAAYYARVVASGGSVLDE